MVVPRTLTDYASEILPITDQVSEIWGRMMAERPLPVIDGLLAATALTHGLTVATRNVGDFEKTNAEIVNPFL